MNAKAYKIYQDVKDMNPLPEVNCELRKEYVRASFPNMKLTDKQVEALTSAADEKDHCGEGELLYHLEGVIDTTRKFMGFNTDAE